MRVDTLRNPPIADDKRPYIGDMVENNAGLQYGRDTIAGINNPWLLDQGDYRFNANHDGEYILGSRDGSRVRAIAGLTGTILAYQKMLPDTNYAVYILLNDKHPNRNRLNYILKWVKRKSSV